MNNLLSNYEVSELSTDELKNYKGGGSKVCDFAAGVAVGVGVFQPHLAPSALLALYTINAVCD